MSSPFSSTLISSNISAEHCTTLLIHVVPLNKTKNLEEVLSDLEFCAYDTFCKSLDENLPIKTTHICEEYDCEALMTTACHMLYLTAHITETVQNPVISGLCINENELKETQEKKILKMKKKHLSKLSPFLSSASLLQCL